LLQSLTLYSSHPPSTTSIHTLSLHDALPISVDLERLFDFDLDRQAVCVPARDACHALPQHRVITADQIFERAREDVMDARPAVRSEEHTSELQSLRHLVCRLLLEKKNKKNNK